MKILIADAFQKRSLDALRTAGLDVVLDPALTGDTLVSTIRQCACDVLVVRSTRVTAEMLDASPALKLVIRAGSGYDTIDVPAATARSIRVCNCPGQNAVAVAELTIGLMIALDRRIVDETDDLRRGVWNKREYSKARGLKGRTLGILGLGRIGYEVAKRAKAFEMRLMYTDVVSRSELEQELGIERVPLGTLLEEADFLTVHVPGGKETRHIIGAPELAHMKTTAVVLNCARGGIVDETALAEAVRAGRIAGAALDVYEIEPGANDTRFTDPLATVPRVYGTHHVGASTEQAQEAVADEVVRIIRAYADHGTHLNCVNPQVEEGAGSSHIRS